MRWVGTALGGAIGLIVGGPVGAVFGAALGQGLDRGLIVGRTAAKASGTHRVDSRTRFFETTFAVMGHLAKTDGRVSEAEIAWARSVMDRMGLTQIQRREAIAFFNQGKSADFDLSTGLSALRTACAGQGALLHLFIELQIMMAYADADPSPEQRLVLEQIREALGVSAFAYRQIEGLVLIQQRLRSGANWGTGQRQSARPGRPSPLNEAYATLGVDPKSTDAEVKTAYRRLMSQHHPDKLMAQGLPEEALRMASRKTQEIRRAYETITEARAI